MIYTTGRSKGVIEITARKVMKKSTERDSSQFKLNNIVISEDLNSRKGIYKILKKDECFSKTTKIISSLKKQKRKEEKAEKVKIYEKFIIRVVNRQRKIFIIDSDDDGENKDHGEDDSDNNVSKIVDKKVKSISGRSQRNQKARKLFIRYKQTSQSGLARLDAQI